MADSLDWEWAFLLLGDYQATWIQPISLTLTAVCQLATGRKPTPLPSPALESPVLAKVLTNEIALQSA